MNATHDKETALELACRMPKAELGVSGAVERKTGLGICH